MAKRHLVVKALTVKTSIGRSLGRSAEEEEEEGKKKTVVILIAWGLSPLNKTTKSESSRKVTVTQCI